MYEAELRHFSLTGDLYAHTSTVTAADRYLCVSITVEDHPSG